MVYTPELRRPIPISRSQRLIGRSQWRCYSDELRVCLWFDLGREEPCEIKFAIDCLSLGNLRSLLILKWFTGGKMRNIGHLKHHIILLIINFSKVSCIKLSDSIREESSNRDYCAECSLWKRLLSWSIVMFALNRCLNSTSLKSLFSEARRKAIWHCYLLCHYHYGEWLIVCQVTNTLEWPDYFERAGIFCAQKWLHLASMALSIHGR